MPKFLRIPLTAFYSFAADDGWAIASHIALSTLMALFPFLLFLTAIAGLLGSKALADEGARILLDTWPQEVAGPLAVEIRDVLASARGGVLTVGAVLALYFASSGVEGLRVGLNRAYGIIEPRRWWVLRLESIIYVIVGALALLALSLMVFLWPLMWGTALKYLPDLARFGATVSLVRLSTAALMLLVALVIVHLWLPAGRRRLRDVAPGIVATLLLWLAAGIIFGRYLADFAFTYSTYYAGLASPMIALAFLYLAAWIFIYGGELNRTIIDARKAAQAPGENKAG
jgi:membrane protein